MVQFFLLFDTITNEKTVKFKQRDIITSTITWHLELLCSNYFGEYTSFSPFTLLPTTQFAYRKGLGTCDAVMYVLHILQSALESGPGDRIMQIDFSGLR